MATRRNLLTGMLAAVAGVFVSHNKTAVAAEKTSQDAEESLRFPGDPTDHNVVFQINNEDDHYQQSVLFAVGELLRKYGDNITIVVTAFGRGIHILAKKPIRPVSPEVQEKVASLAAYGVQFHACGNTMDSLNWKKKDMLPFAEIVQIGAADIMELQEKGYAYLRW